MPTAPSPPLLPIRRVPAWPPERVAALRERLGLSLREFADELGVHWMTVWKWEKGQRGVSSMAARYLEELSAEAANRQPAAD